MSLLIEEEWREIPGWPEYQASSMGRVRSVDRDCWYERWNKYRRMYGKILKPWKKKGTNYESVHLISANRKKNRKYRVHQLVYMAFKGDIPPGYVIMHVNDIQNDNRPSNLELGTCVDNVQDAVNKNRIPHGVRTPQNKYPVETIISVLSRNEDGMGPADISRLLKVPLHTVDSVKHRRSWRHVPEYLYK